MAKQKRIYIVEYLKKLFLAFKRKIINTSGIIITILSPGERREANNDGNNRSRVHPSFVDSFEFKLILS